MSISEIRLEEQKQRSKTENVPTDELMNVTSSGGVAKHIFEELFRMVARALPAGFAGLPGSDHQPWWALKSPVTMKFPQS